MRFQLEIGLNKDTIALANRALDLLERVERERHHMDDILTQLEAEVGNNTTLDGPNGSVVQLINNLAALATQAAPNNARLTAIMNTLTANDQRLAALVVANTPIASPNPVIPPPAPPQTV